MPQIFYKKRRKYKYTLQQDTTVKTGVVGHAHVSHYLSLSSEGLLEIKAGYSWDGPSGVPDSKFFMSPSLTHDALYQLMREKVLPQSARKPTDILMREMLIASGAWPIYASIAYIGVRIFGASAAKPDIKTAS